MINFGTTTVPLAGWVIDPRQPEVARAARLRAIRQLVQEYGLSAVELSLDLGIVYPHVFDASFYAAVADLQRELGFACTVHLPFHWLDLSSANEAIRQASMACLRRALELTRPVHVLTYVAHLWGSTTTQIISQLEDPMERQAILGAILMQAGRSLAELCELIQPIGDLCVENLEEPSFDLFLSLVERYGASICLDVGHLAWQETTALEFLGRHGDRIRELHLHDTMHRSNGDLVQIRDHLALGQGELDFHAIIAELEAIGFQGAVILEVSKKADLETSLAAIKGALPIAVRQHEPAV